jgi:type I restriction enzyme S subunit
MPELPLSEAASLADETVRVEDADPDDVLVGAAELDEHGTLILPPRRVRETRARTAHLRMFKPGDILFIASARGVKAWLADRYGCSTSSIVVLRPTGAIDSQHLLWYLRSGRVTGRRTELLAHRIARSSDPRQDASTVELLERLNTVATLRGQARRTMAKLGVAMFHERFGDPLDERGPWPMATLETLIAALETGWSPRCASRPAQGGEWGVIKVSAVSSGRFLPEENKALPGSTEPRPKLALRAGDLLMVRSNTSALVGTTAIVEDDHPHLLLTDKVWRLRLRDGVDPHYVKGLLSHPSTRAQLARLATGNIASMKNLSQATVLRLKVGIAPTAARAAGAEDLQLIDLAERAQRRQADHLAQLLQDILGAAFAGTPPDPLADVVVDRWLFGELSPLQQAAWRALANADEPATMSELRRRIGDHLGIVPSVDRLRRALDLLAAAGVAVPHDDSRGRRWAEAEAEDLVDVR